MCGIAAIFAYNPKSSFVDEERLMAVRDAMISRGPDGAGIWLSEDRRLGLAHRRLSIIDLSSAALQPMATKDGRLAIVFNGEIYNYKSLKQDLKNKGYQFETTSDTEVLLHLYADRGPGMVDCLRGMYAFAIWDSRKKGLFLARDPFGIKPLYYSDNGGVFQAASQVKALLKGEGIDTSPEPAGHVGFFLFGYVPEPYTLYKGIKALPAGSTLWVDGNGIKGPEKFYDLIGALTDDKYAAPRSPDDAYLCLQEALTDSIRHHFIADVPVGVFLSSGLDSATLTALSTQELGSHDLHTVTLGFEEYRGTQNDETILAEKVAQAYGTKHRTVMVSKNDFQGSFGHLIEAMDQPSIDGVNTYFVSKVAAQTGLKTVISGLGGDELFAGYPSFSQVPKMVSMLKLSRFMPGMGKVFRILSGPFLKHFTSPKYAGLLEYGGDYSGAYLLRRGLFMPWELPDLLNRDMVQTGWEELQPLMRLKKTVEGIESERLKVSALEMTWYMRSQLLRDADWAGMAHSLEIRTPLVDTELLKNVAPLLCLNQPPTKRDMASAPLKALPDEVLDRKKTGFGVPVRDWLLSEDTEPSHARGLRGWATTLYERWAL